MKKMFKYLLPSILSVYFLMMFSIVPVFAAQDVTLSSDMNVTLTSPSTTLVIGSGATFDQIVVNADNIVITMSAGSFPVTITNSDKYNYTVSGISNSTLSCGSSSSTLTLPAQSSAVAVTVTPNTTCSTGGGGGGGTPVGGGGGAPPSTTKPSTTTGNVTASATLGGETTVTTVDGAKTGIDIPGAAISSDTTFTISPVNKTSSLVVTQVAAVIAGQQIVGNYLYNFAASAYGSNVTTFAADLTLTFYYTDADVAGLDLSSLRVNSYNDTSGAWSSLPTTVNTVAKTITATTNTLSYFAVFGSTEAGVTPVDEEAPPAVTPEGLALVDVNGNAIVDGDLITTATSFDIYIVKLIGSKKFKRLILNPDIFNSYGHLSWDNVKTVSQAVQDAYTESTLVIEVNPDGSVYDPKVYSVTSALDADVGIKQWLNMTAEQFISSGYDWDAIYKINHTEASPDFYPEGDPLTYQS